MIKNIKLEIVGISPLLCHRFGEDEALRATSGVRGGQNKDALPRDQAEGFLYLTKDGRPGFPSGNLYRACVDAGRQIKIGRSNLSTQRDSKIPSMFWLDDDTPPILPGDWEVDSRAVVIPATSGRILRYRPRFDSWSLAVSGSFDSTAIAENVLRQLVDISGRCVGIGDFRPSRRGTFGRFTVKNFEVE